MQNDAKRTRADKLLAHVLNGGDDGAANELLIEFLRGYPVENLRLILVSEMESALRAGAWIASELGEMIKPLIRDISAGLDHPSRYVRFFLIDAILNGAGRDDGEALAKAALSIHDFDEAVRWKGLRFLSRATHEQLNWALPYLKPSFSDVLLWLLACDREPDPQSIIDRLSDQDRTVRLCAAAASVRVRPRNRLPLEHAAKSSDPDVKKFAEEELGKRI